MSLEEQWTLRAELSYRIRTASPQIWNEFSQLWMAFNALYGGEPDERERARVIACVRRNVSEQEASSLLERVASPIGKILEIPPANLLLNRYDPRFRAASQRYAAKYRNTGESCVTRLASVAAILYQIRCNLIHGSKDPVRERDVMLVTESVLVLQELLPALEAALSA